PGFFGMTKLNDKAIALLRGKNFAYVATLNRDGSPQLTPVWADTDGKNVLVNTAVGRVKEKNIARDPRVAVATYDVTNPYSWTSVDGKVVKKITGKRADDHIDSLSFKYTGNKKYQGKPKEKRIILVIAPIRIRQWK
ncbi:MAG: PPOX class F420-dependent oxidoreductase, partial [Thaumarchaeota archaeon]|nr:PPOX class F420-dependent oxidoreductase [Nitrososphaerota archaeon]